MVFHVLLDRHTEWVVSFGDGAGGDDIVEISVGRLSWQMDTTPSTCDDMSARRGLAGTAGGAT